MRVTKVEKTEGETGIQSQSFDFFQFSRISARLSPCLSSIVCIGRRARLVKVFVMIASFDIRWYPDVTTIVPVIYDHWMPRRHARISLIGTFLILMTFGDVISKLIGPILNSCAIGKSKILMTPSMRSWAAPVYRIRLVYSTSYGNIETDWLNQRSCVLRKV